MKRVMTIATASVAAVLLTLTMSVSAQDFNTQKRTFLTFSAPVEMPGVTLQAGTYVFKIADTPSRNVVQVFDKDEKDIIGQWLYVSAERPQVTGETVVTFKETREGTIPAVQFWYYPGEKIGREFIYPKDQALRIAARTGIGVRTEEGVVNGSGLPAEEPKAEATVAVAEPAAPPAVDTYGSSAQTTESGVTPRTDNNTAVGTSGYGNQSAPTTDNYGNQSAPATDKDNYANSANNNNVRQESTTAYNNKANAELPRTASRLPLSGLLGFFSLIGAAGLRRFRQQ